MWLIGNRSRVISVQSWDVSTIPRLRNVPVLVDGLRRFRASLHESLSGEIYRMWLYLNPLLSHPLLQNSSVLSFQSVHVELKPSADSLRGFLYPLTKLTGFYIQLHIILNMNADRSMFLSSYFSQIM